MATGNNDVGPGTQYEDQLPDVTLTTKDDSTRLIDARIERTTGTTMNQDSRFTSLHRHRARDADLFESFCRDPLPPDDIYVAAHHQPVNPEDEDDVVPDQHAAFGIQRATQLRREPAWRDFGLAALMAQGPTGAGAFASGAGKKGSAVGGKKRAAGGGGGGGGGSALPR